MILMLYVATESPDENLLFTGNFMIKVYAEMWIRIKGRRHVQTGPTQQFHMLNALRGWHDTRTSSVVTPVIHWKGFVAQRDKVLLGMISD